MKDPRRNLLKVRHGPGIWEDQAGNIHLSIPELLEMVDLEDTPENREEVRRMLMGLIATNAPKATIIERATPDD